MRIRISAFPVLPPRNRCRRVTKCRQNCGIYDYDGLGRRVTKTAGGATTYYIWSGNTLLCELNSSGAVTRGYTWGPGGLVSERRNDYGGISHFFQFDVMGNARQLYNADGTVWQTGGYDPFGNNYLASYPLSAYGYKGQSGAYYDQETGLFLMGARYYAPFLGRFISRDPAGLATGPNPFEFCGNDPVDFADPLGLDFLGLSNKTWCGIGGALIQWSNPATFAMMAAEQEAGVLHNAAANAGYTQGLYDSGKASGWQLASAYANLALQVGLVALPVCDGAGALAGEGEAVVASAASVEAGGEAGGSAAAAVGLAPRAPDFVVTPGGDVIPIPEGATGPVPTLGPGFQYNGGAGGNGLAGNVTDVRIMDPSARYTGGYVNYGKELPGGYWQSVNPYTGVRVGKPDPWWHIPLGSGP